MSRFGAHPPHVHESRPSGASRATSICLRGIQRASVSVSATPCSASSASTPSWIQPRWRNSTRTDVARQRGQEVARARAAPPVRSRGRAGSAPARASSPSSRARSKNRLRDVVGVAQPPLVRDLLRQLEREGEAVRRALAPPAHGLRRRDGVERGIHFDRVERARVHRRGSRRAACRRDRTARPTRRSSIPACRCASRAAHASRIGAMGRGAVKHAVPRVMQAGRFRDRRSRSCAQRHGVTHSHGGIHMDRSTS